MAVAFVREDRSDSRVCGSCGATYEGAHRRHLDASGHVRSRSNRRPDEAFLTSVRQSPNRTIAEIGADHGLNAEAAKRAAAKAGLFRRGRRAANLARDEAIARRSRDGLSRRQLAQEYGLSLSHIYFILRVARARAG